MVASCLYAPRGTQPTTWVCALTRTPPAVLGPRRDPPTTDPPGQGGCSCFLDAVVGFAIDSEYGPVSPKNFPCPGSLCRINQRPGLLAKRRAEQPSPKGNALLRPVLSRQPAAPLPRRPGQAAVQLQTCHGDLGDLGPPARAGAGGGGQARSLPWRPLTASVYLLSMLAPPAPFLPV